MDSSDRDDAFLQVKEYLLACPTLPNNHPFIQAALRGVEQERQRQARDAKLQEKFTAANKTRNNTSSTTSVQNSDKDLEVIESNEASPQHPAVATQQQDSVRMKMDDPEDDWHEISAKEEITAQPPDEPAALGPALAHATVQALAQHGVQVNHPWQALAVALHAALRTLDFDCLGTTPAATTGGFAPPVRALPETQFLPANVWRNNNRQVSLRYRKTGTGAMILNVQTTSDTNHPSDEAVLDVTFGTSTPETSDWQVPIAEHVNLESWARASQRGTKAIAPSLHYKQLAVFLAAFCQRFDVVADSTAEETAAKLPYVDNSILQRPDPATAMNIDNNNVVVPTTIPPLDQPPAEPWMREQQPPTIASAFGQRFPRSGHGDFAGDLMPSGLPTIPDNPLLMQGGGGVGDPGNLMGPGHPLFNGPPGPHGMTPRFDPFGPPQLDIGNTRGRGRGRGSSSGDPNPDHLRPPNNLGNNNNNNMFL